MFQSSLDDILLRPEKGRMRIGTGPNLVERKREPHELLDECLCEWQFMDEVKDEDQRTQGR